MPTRIIIADDDKFFRIGLRSELSKFEDLDITGEAVNGDDLMKMLRSAPPDILLLDLNMPKVSGMEVLEMMSKEAIPIKTIVISANDDERVILKALQAGAKGFFLKGFDIDAAEIYNAISTVANGKFYFNEVMNTALLETKQTTSDEKEDIEFSEIEIDIIRYLSEEMTSQEIAEKTRYSVRTLENKRQELIHRVGATTSIGLVLYAIKRGHVKVPDMQPSKVC